MGFRNLHYINSGEHLLQMQVMREGLLLTYARIPGESHTVPKLSDIINRVKMISTHQNWKLPGIPHKRK